MNISGLILLILAVASAEVIFDGACPAVQPVKDFDMSAYAGMWYHVKKIPVANEGVGKCEAAFYVLDGDSLKLKYSQIIDGVQEFVLGVAKKAVNANNAGKLVVNVNVDKAPISLPLWIVATDYSNYSISYKCEYDEESNTHKLNVWVLSRSQGLDDEAKAAVDAYIRNNFGYVDASKFVVMDLSEEACKFSFSRVYTASSRH